MKRSPLLEKLIKSSPTKHVALMSESVFFQARDVVPTEIPIINAAFSGDLFGGIPAGLTLFAGPSKSFKSLLSLMCVKAYFDKYEDAVCILYDSEGGITPQYLSAMGVDPDRVIHVPVEHIEMLKFDIVRQLKEIERNDHVIIVIDSIGNTASLKELEDALSEKTVADMQRAKSIKGLFRMVTPSLLAKDIPCVTICHTYQEMGLYPKQIISGGCVVAGTKIIMADGTMKEIQHVSVGESVATLNGPKEVTHVWTPDTLFDGIPECYEVEFDDGTKIQCSDSHRFLTTKGWVSVQDIDDTIEIVKI